MRVREAIKHPLFNKAVVRAGATGLDREVAWAHVVDQPDPLPWVRPGQLMLTTGTSLKSKATGVNHVLRRLDRAKIAGIVLACRSPEERFTPKQLAVADTLGLPLIELPWEVPFAEVTEGLHRIIIGDQYKLLSASEEVHRKLTQAALSFRGLHDLAEALGGLLNRAVVVESADGTLLAYHRISGREDDVREVTIATGRRDPSYVRYVRELGLQPELRKSLGPIRIPGSSDGSITARVVCPVRLVSELIAYVWIIEGEEALSELDLRAAEHAATVAALHLSHQREITQTEQRLGATLLDTLLELREEPEAGLLERARLAGLHDGVEWQLVWVALDMAIPLAERDLRAREQYAVRWRGRLLDEGAFALVSTHLRSIVALVPAHINANLLARELELDRHRVLISQTGRTIADVRRRWLELGSMLPHVHHHGVHHHNDFLLPRVLAGEQAAKRELVARMLSGVRGVRGGASLEQTLQALSDNGYALAATAEQLNIHISTLRYRVERAETLLGYTLNDPQQRFLLTLALNIERYEPVAGA